MGCVPTVSWSSAKEEWKRPWVWVLSRGERSSPLRKKSWGGVNNAGSGHRLFRNRHPSHRPPPPERSGYTAHIHSRPYEFWARPPTFNFFENFKKKRNIESCTNIQDISETSPIALALALKLRYRFNPFRTSGSYI